METLISIFNLLGSLAMFLYGMKIMSEGLEKLAGDQLRNVLAAMTQNRFAGVLTGLFVTALIQSSSATTVMVVSFVNAGLMNLAQAIGVIMGANIGTTVTAWIISAIGFKVDIVVFSIPLLAIGMPLIFSSKSKRKNIGEFIFGFSFLFMGLNFLQTAANSLHIDHIVANILSNIPCDNFLAIILFVIIGAIVTVIVQSSSAMMAITLMLFGMNIPGFGFEQAAALAMGQNIGTTITALMASMTANTQAKRAAFAHMFFNVFGVLLFLIIFYPTCNITTWLATEIFGESNDLYKLSLFHTAFNIINTVLLIGFVKQIEMFVCKILPLKEQDEEYRLRYISSGLLSTSELSMLEAQKEIMNFGTRCKRMFGFVKELLTIEKDEDFNKLYSRIEKYEKITDDMEVEIANYLRQVGEGHLSSESKIHIQQMYKQISELESIGDSCFNLARTLNRRKQNSKEKFTEEQTNSIRSMMTLVDNSLEQMIKNIELGEHEMDFSSSVNIETEINNYRKQLRSKNFYDVKNGVYSYQLGVFYMDFISECEKLGDYVINVVQATRNDW